MGHGVQGRFPCSLPGLALLIAIPACAQAPASSPELSSHDSEPTFQTRVNLVTVPVVVRDHQGKTVGNLTKEDFLLFDKGKPQVISKFTLERQDASAAIREETSGLASGAPAPKALEPIASQFTAYVFDDLHLDFADLSQARTAAEKHLAGLAPASRAAIFTTSGLTTLDFTNDQARLKDTLRRLMPRSRAGTPQTECPYVSYYMADRIVNFNDATALQAETLEAIACGDPPQTAQSDARGAAMHALSVGELETRTTLSVLRDIVRRAGAMPGARSVVLISPGFLSTRDQPELTGIVEQAIRLNVVISGLDARGLYTTGVADASRQVRSAQAQQMIDSYDRDAALTQADTLAELADGTGGSFFHNSNDLFAGFEQAATPPAVVYLLGFSPENLKNDGKYHVLKVGLKDAAGLNLRARRGYYAPKADVDAAGQARQEIEDALFSRQELRDFPISFHTQFFKASDQSATLSVLARLDVRRIHFRKEQNRNCDDLTVVSALFDRNGNFIKATEKRLELRLKDSTLESGVSAGIAVKTSFDVTPGSYVIRLVVRDAQGQMMSAANGAVEIP